MSTKFHNCTLVAYTATMKKFVLPLALLLVIALCGCGKDLLVGTWIPQAPPNSPDVPSSMTFKADKTFEVKMTSSESAAISGTWELKDKEVSVKALKIAGMDIPANAQKPETAQLSDDGKRMTIQGVSFVKQ